MAAFKPLDDIVRYSFAFERLDLETMINAEASTALMAARGGIVHQTVGGSTKQLTTAAHCAGLATASAIRASQIAKLIAAEVDVAEVYDAYFAVLDEALEAGPQGEPWSAVAIDEAACLYKAAGGLATA